MNQDVSTSSRLQCDALDIVRSVSESFCTNHIFIHRPDITPLPTDSSLRCDGYSKLHLLCFDPLYITVSCLTYLVLCRKMALGL
jgi:hypothetical protein